MTCNLKFLNYELVEVGFIFTYFACWIRRTIIVNLKDYKKCKGNKGAYLKVKEKKINKEINLIKKTSITRVSSSILNQHDYRRLWFELEHLSRRAICNQKYNM